MNKSILLKKISLLIAGFCISNLGLSQSSNVSLKDLIKMADGKSTDIQLIEATKEVGMSQVNEYRSQVFPQVNLNLGSNRVWKKNYSMLSSLPPQMAKMFGVTPTSPYDKNVGYEHFWSVDLNTPIFSFGRLTTVYDMAKEQSSLVNTTYVLQKEQLYRQIINTYNQALLDRNLMSVAIDSQKQSESVYKFTQIEYNSGSRTKVDFLQTKATSEIMQAQLQAKRAAYDKSIADLKLLVGVDGSQTLVMSTEPKVDECFVTLPAGAESKPTGENLTLQVTHQQTRLAELQSDYDRSTRWPSIYLTGKVNSAIDTSSTKDEYLDLYDDKNFNYSVGVALRWNLFDGLGTTSRMNKSAAQKIMAQKKEEKDIQSVSIALNALFDQISSSRKMYEASTIGNEAAQLYYNQIEKDYKRGSASIMAYLDAQTKLTESKNQVFSAYANMVRVTTEYKFLKGLPLKGGCL